MNKHFVRLLVAFAAFSLGLILTSFLRSAPVRTKAVRIYIPQEQLLVVSSEDEAQIMHIYREYGPAQTRHDREFFQRVETERFTLTVGDLTMSRAEDITWMEGQPAGIIYESKVDHLKVFGNLAVAHGRFEIWYGNGDIRVCPFVDVWVKDGNTWRIHSTTSR